MKSDSPMLPKNTAHRKRKLKRSEIVASDLIRDIVSNGLKEGDRLPLESDMLVEYGVSRSTLREAMRLLETQGLINIRPGPGGGTMVGGIDPSNLAHTLTLYLHRTDTSLDDLLDAWLTVEPLLARLAASHPDRKRVRDGMAPFLEVNKDSCIRTASAGLQFHDVVAELAGNKVLYLMLAAVGFLVTEQMRLSVPDLRLTDETLDAHSEIAEAISNGNAKVAEELMHEHVECVVQEIRGSVGVSLNKLLRLE